MDTSYSTLTILQNLNLACNPVIKRDIPIKELTIINYARVSMDEYFIIIRGITRPARPRPHVNPD